MPYRHGLLCACSGGGPALPSQAGPLSAACSAHTGASVHGAHPTNRVRLAHTACKGPSAEQAGGSRLACCAQRAQACLEADDRARHLVAHDVAGMVEDGSRPAQRMECQRKAEVTTLCACWRAREREREREGSASCRAAKNPTHPASTQRTACPPPPSTLALLQCGTVLPHCSTRPRRCRSLRVPHLRHSQLSAAQILWPGPHRSSRSAPAQALAAAALRYALYTCLRSSCSQKCPGPVRVVGFKRAGVHA